MAGGDREEKVALKHWGTTDPLVLENKLSALRKKISEGPDWILREKLKSKPCLIIVDECSMVNEALAKDLMSFGIPIIVIGDPFQLPPPKGPKGSTLSRTPC
jgi:exodeoxyribonuclease-5